MCPEYMHNICLGIVKALMEMTFADGGGEHKKRLHARLYIAAQPFSDAMMATKVPSEFQRATRSLSQGSWKSEESRNCILFYFVFINRYGPPSYIAKYVLVMK